MAVKKVDTVRQNTLQVISLNKEKARVNDSIHNTLISHQGAILYPGAKALNKNKNSKTPYLNIPQRYKNQVQRKG